MYNKIIGIIFTAVGILFLLGALGAITNDWPMKKILFVSGIQLLIAVFPLIIGIKLLRKQVDTNSKKV